MMCSNKRQKFRRPRVNGGPGNANTDIVSPPSKLHYIEEGKNFLRNKE